MPLTFTASASPLTTGEPCGQSDHQPLQHLVLCEPLRHLAADPLFADYIDFVASEDCLFLDLYSPRAKGNFLLLFGILSGSYRLLSRKADFFILIETNDNGFVVGAFGFRQKRR